MSCDQRKEVVRQLATFQAQLLQIPFLAIGSKGIVGPLRLSSTYPFNLRGPHRGPFASSKHFLEAHVRCELSFIGDRSEWILQRTYRAMSMMATTCPPRMHFSGSLFFWRRSLLYLQKSSTLHLTLCHDDFPLSSIPVSPSGTVVGPVDWQGSRICPLWNDAWYATFLEDPSVLEDLKKSWICSGTSTRILYFTPLRLDYLLHITDYSHSVAASRAHLDVTFFYNASQV
ncbi:hypothetical protein B0H19DRAFT_386883 [Mycena capillaripes]|nr:hypothetical protein B0H19DRAFT_386883 [Mycena capillaripes]